LALAIRANKLPLPPAVGVALNIFRFFAVGLGRDFPKYLSALFQDFSTGVNRLLCNYGSGIFLISSKVGESL
jgi:hypothetical protein